MISRRPIATLFSLLLLCAIPTAAQVVNGPIVGCDGVTTSCNGGQVTAPYANIDLFGTGADGNVTISGLVVLTRDMNYNNLTLAAGANLRPAGFRIFVANVLDLSAAPHDAIQTTQSTGSNGSGATGGTYTNPGISPLSPITGSGAGGAGQTGAGSAGGSNTGAQVNTGNGGRTGAGGAGGASGSAGGAGAVQGKPSFNPGGLMIAFPKPNTGPFWYGIANAGQSFMQNLWPSYSAGGGGGGGGDGVNAGGGGGASATPPYGIAIYASTIARGTNATTFIIDASGSKGGNGANGTGGNAGGGGGAGGTGGSAVYIVAGKMTGNTIVNAIDVSGGQGGTGGNGIGTGNGGTGGDGGANGSVQIIVLSPPSYTQSATFNTAGGVGTAGGVNAGGAGGGGQTQQVNL